MLTRFSPLKLLFSCLYLGVVLSSHAIAQPSTSEHVAALHDAFSKIRNAEYGNVHLIIRCTVKGSNGLSSEKRISYWAKDGRKFRIDEDALERREDASKMRWIVRPEGSVQLRQTDNGFAVVNLSSNGMERVSIEDFYGASTRCFSIIDAEATFGFATDLGYTNPLSQTWAKAYTPLEISRVGNELKLKSRFESSMDGPGSSSVVEVKFDLVNHVHLSYEQLSRDANAYHSELQVVKEYDFERLRHIPRSIKVNRVRASDGAWDSTELIVEHVDWSPVPDGIFSFEAQGVSQSSVWTRRFIMVTIGVAMLGLFLFYRQMRKRV